MNPSDNAQPSALAGVRVLDLASVGPAARASSILADYGADVVKVGPVPRDAAKQITPSHYAYSGQRRTRRIQIDLKSPLGRDAFLSLVRHSDVVLESYRPGVMTRLGIGFDTLRQENPQIILCSTSGFGQDGPRASEAGHDIDYQAITGALSCAEPAAGIKPGLPGATFADSAGGGMHAAIAILAALKRRHATHAGEHLDVSIADGMLNLMSLAIDEYLATDVEPHPGHGMLTGRYACYGTYQCADGQWLAVGAIEAKFFANLCTALGHRELIDSQLDDTAQPTIRVAFTSTFATRTRAEWLDVFASIDACVAPVLQIADVVHDPQFIARQAVVLAEHPTHGRFKQLAPTLAGMDPIVGVIGVPDASVTDTDDVFAQVGVDEHRVAHLRAQGVIA